MRLKSRQKRRPWTPAEDEYLKVAYVDPSLVITDLEGRLGRPRSSIYQRARRLGLDAPVERLRKAGARSAMHPNTIASRFGKGSVPWNKGVPMSEDLYAKCAPTMFRKGNRPWKQAPVGAEVKGTDGYWKVKVADPNRWRLKHHLVWEEANGPIPKGWNVAFRDGNPDNVAIGNLYLENRVQNMRRNTIAEADEEKRRQAYDKCRNSRNKLILQEQIRIKYGLPQESKLRLRKRYYIPKLYDK